MAAPPLTKLFKEFFESEKTGGLLLGACTIISILLTNSPPGADWLHFWHTPRAFAGTGLFSSTPQSLEFWVNDGLMAIFFLLVGLEIEREIYLGELSNIRKALLPILAALGGMIVPAGIHFLFNHGTPGQAGIGIPMATDIAFALGALSLLGNRISPSVKVFLTALAIIDDLGAILVIAVFYTKTLSFLYLAAALGICGLLLIFNRMKINNLWFYLLPGILIWYCMLRSGIHATLAGVMLAFVIPFRKTAGNPSEKLQHWLHKPAAYIILPIFALANTGLLLTGDWTHSLTSTNSLGIIAGLVLGKPIGILLFSGLGIRAGLSTLPENMTNRHLIGIGMLAGIGFTMSIFITNLAFDDDQIIGYSKIAVLIASLLSGILGYFYLLGVSKK